MAEKRRLGSQGPEITTIGFGAWAAGGPWFAGWGHQDDNDSIDAIRRSIEAGCNWIDTAAVYGIGHSEEVVGKAIEGCRDNVLIFTKCGRIATATERPHGDLRPESIRPEVEASLRRLKVDVIDLYQIHWPECIHSTPIEDAWGVLAELKREGKVRWIGVSNFDVAQLKRCEAIAHVDSLQPPYSLLRQEVAEEILPFCLKNGTGVVAYSPMQGGLLSGRFDISRVAQDDWRRRHPFYQEPNLSRNLAFVESLRPIAATYNKTVGQLAIRWVLSNPAMTGAIVGARNPEQVDTNAEAMGWELTNEDLAAIATAYRILQTEE